MDCPILQMNAGRSVTGNLQGLFMEFLGEEKEFICPAVSLLRYARNFQIQMTWDTWDLEMNNLNAERMRSVEMRDNTICHIVLSI